jgi:spectinomycin phosphotransferase
MLVKQALPEQRIIECLANDYNIEVVTLTLLPLGADMHASVYKVDARDQFSYFVKLKHGHDHNIGITVVELLHNAGIQHIIRPLKTINGQSTQEIDEFTLIAYPYIEGQNGFSRALTDAQ